MEETAEQYANIRERLMNLSKQEPRPVGSSSHKQSGLESSAEMHNSEATLLGITNSAEQDDSSSDCEVTTVKSDESETVHNELRRSSRKRRTPEIPNFVSAEEAAKIESEVLGECPICQKRMKVSEIQGPHIAMCLNSQKGTSSFRSRLGPRSSSGIRSGSTLNRATKSSGIFGGEQASPAQFKKLPTLHYSSLNDSKLRDVLSRLGLSKKGSRSELERRHVNFLNLWNANCDSKSPVSRPDILRQLDAMERTQGDQSNVKIQTKGKNFDSQAWSQSNSSQFNDLILQARNNMKKRRTDALSPSEPTNS
ncbi:E3 ubiquitin-protein ligase RAD18 [Sugiyamaella lignohabitans]|uniref:E3 ubiquitin-protein ligase RAD18 n=1 Tax=Sugiyamaella lignohabitans TaxID=796027 RepID=A0A167DZN3_9ASCO|nr:E3 ubiquitin-protein ligase RAD18 [Sugiyamaella lignohabitans]ANB13474.1 E3 ubiquitin-protein ligase RAD18 [Sugiyamaella lignohabitans]